MEHTKQQTAYTAVVTVVGEDKPGIIWEVTGVLAKYKVNVQDISQTILQGLFHMIMLVDTEEAKVDLDVLREALHAKGEEISCSILLQHKDVFSSMHRI